MKKIINGKLYDTDTARECGYYSNYFRGDFNFYEETLYQKRTGEFFLHGSGNAASPYSTQVDSSSWAGGQRIIPMTEDEAKSWAERKLDADEYIALFGAVEE